MTREKEIEIIIENEWYGVRHSGEIPEIALHSAFYYLTDDQQGPQLDLTAEISRKLVQAAELRYREIVLRDLIPDNRETSGYRGVKRSIANWDRFEVFCERQNVDSTGFRHEAAAALLVFLTEEVVDVERQKRRSSINCSFEELINFADRLGLVNSVLPASIRGLCLE